jgi:hypothetical protein
MHVRRFHVVPVIPLLIGLLGCGTDNVASDGSEAGTAVTSVTGGISGISVTGGSGGTSGSGGAGKGGSAGSGGQAGGSGGSGGSSCSSVAPNVTPCGGDVVGTWTLTSGCLKVTGEFDLSSLGIGCTSGTLTGSLQVTGTWTANSNGTYSDNTTTSGDEQLTLPASCLNVSGTTTNCEGLAGVIQSLGYDSISCKAAASGGCTCSATIRQSGGLGLVSSDPSTNGNYATSSNAVTTNGGAKYSYCVSGSTMTWTPQSTRPATAGTVVFQKGGSAGAGGASGTGGAAGIGGTAGSGGGAAGAGGSTTRSNGPCDIYATASPATPCVAAYSMVRALSKSYNGPLYQVRKNSSSTNTGTGGTTADIGMLPDGYADTATQDAFCAGTVCTVSLLYDQSGNKNNLKVAPKGAYNCGTDTACEDDYESSATKGAVTAGGHKVYSLYMVAHEGYRFTAKGAGMPLGTEAQGIYMLADGTHYGTACCWDFGNVTTDPTKYGDMNTLFFGQAFWGKGADNPPWFMADFEAGVWAGGSKVGDPGWGALNDAHPVNPKNPSMKGVAFAFGVLKTGSGKYAIRVADTQKATDLTTAYDGSLPKPNNKLGGIVLGVGGDNSNHSWGTFFEGAITAGSPSDATDLAVVKNVQAVGYAK